MTGKMKKTDKLIRAIAAGGVVLVFTAVFFSGCEGGFPALEQVGGGSVDSLLPAASRIVQDGLTDSNPRIRANVIEVIADSGQTQFAGSVQKLLGDESVPVRFAAAQGLGDLKYSAARGALKQALNDPDENVRIAAGYALSMLGDGANLDIVKKAIKSKDQTVRANATVLLGKAGDKDNIGPLYEVLRDADSDYKVRFQALEAIARLGDEEVYRKLWTMLISVYADDRAMGVRAMGSLGTRKAKDILITKLDDDVLEVRLAAAEQLGMLRDKSGEKEVLAVFEKNLTAGMEAEERVRVNVLAALAIGRIGGDSLPKYLPGLLKNESKFVRIAAGKAVFLLAGRN